MGSPPTSITLAEAASLAAMLTLLPGLSTSSYPVRTLRFGIIKLLRIDHPDIADTSHQASRIAP